jgi:3,4-dihydroxy 2-butanone 4-phosphate synthase/GTP cyclohydrolase II
MAHIATMDRGVVALIGQPQGTDQLLSDVHQFLSTNSPPPQPQNYRLIGTGAQILRHLGVTQMQLLSAPLKFNALSGFNLEVAEFISEPMY